MRCIASFCERRWPSYLNPHPQMACLALAIVLACRCCQAQDLPSGSARISAPFGDSEIVITTTARLAGAIDSLTWNGQEFINSHDHGRQLQSASNFDAGSAFSGETFNPTEAGSRKDGAGPTSTSRLLHMLVKDRLLQTTTQMAFWLSPDEKSSGHPAKNRTILSNHLLTKRVVIGHQNFPNVIRYDVTFSVPVGEHHTYAQFEALTGYMPSNFSDFFCFDPSDGTLNPVTDGPGEQSLPLIFSTPSGSHAMGVYSAQQPSPGYKQAGYGRFRFRAARVVKWNCVFRVRNRVDGIEPADYSYRVFVIVGNKPTVRSTMARLIRTESESQK